MANGTGQGVCRIAAGLTGQGEQAHHHVCHLLFGGFAVTFGSAVCGTAIMSLPSDDRDDGPSGGHREDERDLELALIPIPVRARRK